LSRGPTTFRQRDVAAAIKAARQAGIVVGRIEVDKAGKIVIVAGKPEEPDKPEVNEWDAP
jgi:imidazolonepropionase-like amidohydrolase